MAKETLFKLIQETDKEIVKLQKQKKIYQEALSLEGGNGNFDMPLLDPPKRFIEMARGVLASSERNPKKEPQHAKKIGAWIQADFNIPVDSKSLSQMLYANAKVAKKKYFFKDRTRDNTYGLLEWQK